MRIYFPYGQEIDIIQIDLYNSTFYFKVLRAGSITAMIKDGQEYPVYYSGNIVPDLNNMISLIKEQYEDLRDN